MIDPHFKNSFENCRSDLFSKYFIQNIKKTCTWFYPHFICVVYTLHDMPIRICHYMRVRLFFQTFLHSLFSSGVKFRDGSDQFSPFWSGRVLGFFYFARVRLQVCWFFHESTNFDYGSSSGHVGQNTRPQVAPNFVSGFDPTHPNWSSLMWKIKSKHAIRQQLFSTVTNLVSFCLNQKNKNKITFSSLCRSWSTRKIHPVIKMENEDVIFFHKLSLKGFIFYDLKSDKTIWICCLNWLKSSATVSKKMYYFKFFSTN